ncbi:MAG: hypothetical protein JWM80_3238 [Cyanobacteria bacterium RYN_339]|nr:hypothetical protein [Cyanobacteria bacterium RYN_339]
MSTIRPVAKTPSVARTVPVANVPAPVLKGLSPKPTKLALNALAQMDRERPKFHNPEDYKNYVIKFAGYKRMAQADVQAAQTELEQVQAMSATAEADYRRPLEAARADLDHAKALYQGPIDQAKHDRDEANTALDVALYPGKPHAAQLEAEATRTAEAIKDLEGKIAAGQTRLGSLDGLAADAKARQQTALATKADAEAQIKRLEASFNSNSSIEERRAALQSALNAASRDLEAAKGDLARLQEQDRQHQADLDERASQLAGGLSDLQGRLQTSQARQAIVVGQLVSETSRRDRAAATARDEADQADRLRSQASPDRVSNQDSRVRRARQDAETANQALGKAQADENRRSTLQGQISRLTAASGEYSAAVSTRNGLKGQVTTKKQTLDTAQAASAALEPQRAHVRDAQSKLDAAHQAVSKAQADVRQYESLDTAVKALTGLKSSYADATRAADGARSAVTDKKAALDQASQGSAEVNTQQQRVADARRKVDTARSAVTKLQAVDAAISALEGLKSEYDSADNSRSAYKGQVTRKKTALNDAMASGDGAKITSAKAAYDDEVSKYNDADAKCRAIGSRMSQYGASPDSLASVLSAKQSEHASLSSAPSALSSAQSELDAEQRKLDGMSGVASRITSAKAAYDDAVRTLSDAQSRQRSVASQMSSYGASPDSLDSVISTKSSQRSALSGASSALSSAQSSESSAQANLDREKANLAQSESGIAATLAAAKSAYDDAVGQYNTADQRVRDLASRMAADGANPDNLDAEISRRRSELANLPANGVETARTHYQGLRDTLDREEAELRRLQGLAGQLADHDNRKNQAANERNDADRQLVTLGAELARLKADEPTLRASIGDRQREADQARAAADTERSKQASPDHLQHERDRVANAQSPFDKAKNEADQIAALWDALQGQKARLADAVKTSADAVAAEKGFIAEKGQLTKDVPTWTGDRDKKTADRQRMLAQAKQERETQAPTSSPDVAAAHARVDAVAKRLNEAQATFDREVGGLQGKLDTEQRGYDAKMSALKQRADAAGPALEAARKEVADVDKEFNELPRAVSGWTRFWWHMAYHFDVDAFWKEQGPKLRDQMAR